MRGGGDKAEQYVNVLPTVTITNDQEPSGLKDTNLSHYSSVDQKPAEKSHQTK